MSVFTRDELVKMARAAGFQSGTITLTDCEPMPFVKSIGETCLVEVENLAKIICDELATKHASVTKSFADEVRLLGEEVDNLRAKKFAHFRNDECWIYQGDDEDHLESLTCPVVISAYDLMKLKEKAERGSQSK